MNLSAPRFRRIPSQSLATIAAIRPNAIGTTARQLIGRRGITRIATAKVRAGSIPSSVRRVGMSRQWLKGVDNGHVRPVATFAKGKNWASNQRWEVASLNRGTGAGRKPVGYWQQNVYLLRIHTVKTVACGSLRAAGYGVVFAAAIETPFTVYRQCRQMQAGKLAFDAVVDGGKEVGRAAAIGGVVSGASFTLAAGVGLAPAVAIISGSTLAFHNRDKLARAKQSASKRIRNMALSVRSLFDTTRR